MPLPNGFSEWEHLQSTLMSVHNRRVRDNFNDVDDDNDISTPRSSLRQACLLKDDDSAPMTQLRMWLFYVILRGASDMHPPLYTLPVERYQESVRFAPQVTLYFREDLEDVEPGYKPIDAEVSFRIMGETSQSFTPANAMSLAQRIRSEFTTSGSGYRWKKGRVKLNYRHKDEGYQFSVNAFTELEGREVINKVVSLRGNTVSNDHLSITELGAAPPIVPASEQIYGEFRRTARRRPIGWVRFRYAECHVWGIDKPITLVDATLRRANPLLRA